MVNLGQLSASDSYAQTSGSGFGTRALCRRLSRHSAAPVDMDVWLSGLRRANPFNATTNPVPNAHMRSPGGFMETFPGLRDGGDIQFEATFKNDCTCRGHCRWRHYHGRLSGMAGPLGGRRRRQKELLPLAVLRP